MYEYFKSPNSDKCLSSIARNLGAAQSSGCSYKHHRNAMSLTNGMEEPHLVKEREPHFEIVRNNSLGISFGGSGKPIPDHFALFLWIEEKENMFVFM